MSPLWLVNFPLPPSVNEYLMPVAGNWAVNKNGKQYRKGRWVKTKVHTDYVNRCHHWRLINRAGFDQARDLITKEVDDARMLKLPIAYRVDCYFAFEYGRIWTKDNQPQEIDSDNRLKPCRDALAKILGIDDKYFFSGFFEKVTTNSKDSECTILKISRAEPRTLEQIQSLITKKPVTLSAE